MKYILMKEPGKLTVEEREMPLKEPNKALIRMAACGICGSDLTAYLGTNPTVRYPINGIGHEGVGTIEDIEEEDVKRYGLKKGDRVALEPCLPCGQCYCCQKGNFNNCVNLKVAGVHTDGMMSQFCVYPPGRLHKLPDSLDFYQAALAEPLTIGLHGISRAGVQRGEFCLITGAGPIGLLTALGVMSRGAIPILLDIVEERLDFAKKLGIPFVHNSGEGSISEYLEEVTKGKLPERMIECSGSAKVLGEMHEYVCYGGTITTVGWAKKPVTINTIRCMQKELTICASRNSTGNFGEALSLIDRKEVPADKMITKIAAMEDVEAVIRDMIANPQSYLKVVVTIK